jgi:hypothetical protein
LKSLFISEEVFVSDRFAQRAGVHALLVAGLLLLAPVAGWSQAKVVPYFHAGTVEAGAFLGSSYGLDSWRVMGGGNVAFGLTRVIMPYAEYSYFPGIQRQATFTSGSLNYSVPVSDFHGGVHLRLPLGESPVVPYAVAGVGALRFGDANVKIKFPDGTIIGDTITGKSSFAANFGGGIRFYTREHVGFRFEAKVYKPTGQYTEPFYKVEGGIFFQFR